MADSTRRTLLLTGVAEGLGADIAETFARAGHDVVGISRTNRSTEHLTHRVEQAGGRYTHLVCDITQAADAAAAIEPYAGRIDVMIHNAHVLDYQAVRGDDGGRIRTGLARGVPRRDDLRRNRSFLIWRRADRAPSS